MGDVGDSPTDYAMADELHALGHAVRHVDVGPSAPSRGVPTRCPPCRAADDAAGAAHLHALRAELTGDSAGR